MPVATVDVLALPERAPSLIGITVQSGPTPVVARQPVSVKAAVGRAASLEVGMDGDGPSKYQWYFNGKPIEGATESTLTFPELRASALGYYFVNVRWAHPDPGGPWIRSRTAFLVDRERGHTRGGLRRELYREIPGGAVADLTASPKFPHQPDEVDVVSAFESPPDIAEHYGVRLSGYVLPPETASTTSISARTTAARST